MTTHPTDEHWMSRAIAEARSAARRGDVPVGAVLVRGDEVIAAASNECIARDDPTAHAELLVLRAGARILGEARLGDCTLFVTLEPCAMCAGAIVLSRVGRVVFGAWDPKSGMAGSVADLLRNPRLNHQPRVRAEVMATESAALLLDFFALRRTAKG